MCTDERKRESHFFIFLFMLSVLFFLLSLFSVSFSAFLFSQSFISFSFIISFSLNVFLLYMYYLYKIHECSYCGLFNKAGFSVLCECCQLYFNFQSFMLGSPRDVMLD